ncbi:MAG: hypothetical protein WBW53_09850 [Terriglobales bacterium]
MTRLVAMACLAAIAFNVRVFAAVWKERKALKKERATQLRGESKKTRAA